MSLHLLAELEVINFCLLTFIAFHTFSSRACKSYYYYYYSRERKYM